jgi:hypothetical protein
VPYGWRVGADKRLERDEPEAQVLSRARELRAEGRSLRAVAATLIAEGHRPRNGGVWAIQTIRRVTTGVARLS